MINLFKQRHDLNVLYAPLSGKVVQLDNVPDVVFSERILGDRIAIEPVGTTVVSPVAGEMTMLLSSGHAIGLKADSGAEALIISG